MNSPINTSLSLGQALAGAAIREPSRARQYCGGHFLSPFEIAAMREYAEDHIPGRGEDAESLEWIPDVGVLRWISGHYEGGIAGFLGAGPVGDEDLSADSV